MRRTIALLLTCACATTHHPAVPPAIEGPPPEPPKLVSAGNVEVASHDVDGLVHEVRGHVQAARGYVTSEEVTGTAGAMPRATLRVRLPPPEIPPFVDWLGTRSNLLARRLGVQDVSREYFDEELALSNLRTTLERLEDIAAQGAKLHDVLEVEKELTRLRGEIARIEGGHRGRGDQVALATLDVSIAPAEEALAPRAMFQLMPSAAVLALVDARGREAVRAGGGLTLAFSRHLALELQLFPARGGEGRSALVTLHAAAYSDFFGGGRRRFLNPHLGLLAGGGSFAAHGAFTAGATLGVELYRGRRLLVDLGGRAQCLLYGSEAQRPADVALQVGLGAGVPF